MQIGGQHWEPCLNNRTLFSKGEKGCGGYYMAFYNKPTKSMLCEKCRAANRAERTLEQLHVLSAYYPAD